MSRRAIITGAAQGIGQGIADRLVSEGWDVTRLDVREGEGVISCDVSDEASVATAFDALSERLAPGLDLLVNNAGIAHPYTGPVEDLSLDDWNRWIGTNLTGAFLMTRAAVPYLRKAKGSIVNISSTRAFQSEPHSEAYAASKSGLVGLTHALAVSLGPDIRANCIAPGWINAHGGSFRPADHAQHPAGRIGTVDDIADTVLYLATSGFVTGQTITVDGGMTHKMIWLE
jgi:NAD(P)-dependent dehydrogenase (short-subunit alcohol dehydrogenase family)